ncbi:MAG: hypothetical protein ACRDNY_11370 [Gaiellaceae bacterium]
MTDQITLTIPTEPRLRGVATLVLGGIGSRLNLPYERMDDLQLAVLSVLGAGGDEHVTLEVDADGDGLAVSLGPLRDGSGSDVALTRVLHPLVDSMETVQRDGQEWLTLRMAR